MGLVLIMPLFTSRMENLGEEKESVHAFKGAPALLDYSIKDYERNMKFSEEEVVYPIRYVVQYVMWRVCSYCL